MIGNVGHFSAFSLRLYLFKGNTMPQGVLTEQQREAQKAKLKEFHEKGKTGEAKTSAGTVRPRKNRSLKTLADRMSDMLPTALNIIEDVLEGKVVDKNKADMAKYVANNAVTLTKAQIEHESALLKYKVDMEKAKAANVIPREDPQEVAREMASKGEHIQAVNPLSHLEAVNEFPEEEEFFASDKEYDEED